MDKGYQKKAVIDVSLYQLNCNNSKDGYGNGKSCDYYLCGKCLNQNGRCTDQRTSQP